MTPAQSRMARAALQLGIRDVAKLAGVAASTISRLEAGETLQPYRRGNPACPGKGWRRVHQRQKARRAGEVAAYVFMDQRNAVPRLTHQPVAKRERPPTRAAPRASGFWVSRVDWLSRFAKGRLKLLFGSLPPLIPSDGRFHGGVLQEGIHAPVSPFL